MEFVLCISFLRKSIRVFFFSYCFHPRIKLFLYSGCIHRLQTTFVAHTKYVSYQDLSQTLWPVANYSTTVLSLWSNTTSARIACLYIKKLLLDLPLTLLPKNKTQANFPYWLNKQYISRLTSNLNILKCLSKNVGRGPGLLPLIPYYWWASDYLMLKSFGDWYHRSLGPIYVFFLQGSSQVRLWPIWW